MARFVEIKIEGENEILAALERVEHRQRERTRRILDNFADMGLFTLRRNLPMDRSGYLRRHSGRSAVTWRPGGAGGGGSYEAVFGIKRGNSKHPFYVEFGTGLYGVVGWYIVPHTHRYMVFYSTLYRRRIRVTKTRGQRPQRYFYTTWRELQVYATTRMTATDLLN